jgi:pimeloyl-ACP methyl ester carboxylesterase
MPDFIAVPFQDRILSIEHLWLNADRIGQPLLVFLHEGLGSVSMWRDFPQRLCDAANCRGLVFSRYGYGCSTPRPDGEKWPVDFMHQQAAAFMPALFAALNVQDERPILFGHSDGGSIALLYAALHPQQPLGVIALAPHIMVEPVSVDSIAKTRQAYLGTDLKQRLARHHQDPDSAFWGWNDVWLNPAFAHWNIEALLPSIRCPVLAIQGVDDEYGTLAQIRGIARALPATRLVELAACGHSPHRDQGPAVIREVTEFLEMLQA